MAKVDTNKSITEVKQESYNLEKKIKDLDSAISSMNAININYEPGSSFKNGLEEITTKYEDQKNYALVVNSKFEKMNDNLKIVIEDINKLKTNFNKCKETLLKVNEYRTNFDYNKVRHILNEFDKSIFENPNKLKAIDDLKQMFYWTLAETISKHGSGIKLRLTEIDEYLDVVSKLENFRVNLNKNFYIEDACRHLLIVLNTELLSKDLFDSSDFALYHSYFVTLKKYRSIFSEDTITRYDMFEAKMINWYNKISTNAFEVQSDINKAVNLFLMRDVFNKNDISVKVFNECNSEEELRNKFEQNVIATCNPQGMENILLKAIAKKGEFKASNVAEILKSKFIQLNQLPTIIETLEDKLNGLQRWEIVDELISKHQDTTYREIIEALILSALKKKSYRMYLPTICHYLLISYQYTENKNTKYEIVKFSERIFASPKVYRDRYKLDGYEIMQVYRISKSKKINKKKGFNYLGEPSDVVEGKSTFIPKNKHHITLLKTLVFILMALVVGLCAAALIYFKIDIYDPKMYMIVGGGIALLGLLMTYYIVFFNSYDELKAIIARYSIYILLILGTALYSYLYFSNISQVFNANSFNISILAAILGAVLNFLSYFYINKNEKPGLKVTFIIVSTICAIYLIAMMVYTILTFPNNI